MEEFDQTKNMVNSTNPWDLPLSMNDQIIATNGGDDDNHMMIPLSGTPLWSSFIFQSSHQRPGNSPSSSQIVLPTAPLLRDARYVPGFGLDMVEDGGDDDEQEEELGAMKEMMYRIAAMQPVDIDPLTIRKLKRRNVRISDDPQSVAARHRRERISEKIRILQRLVPGGMKMDTASMLDEAIRYVRFLKRQVRSLQSSSSSSSNPQNDDHPHPTPSIPILAGEPWQVPQSNQPITSSTSSSSAELVLPAPQPGSGFITWNSNGTADSNMYFHHEVSGNQ